MAAGLGPARALHPGTGSFQAGIMLTPDLIGGMLDARARFNEHIYGFAEARGGYSFAHGKTFGEAFVGIGGEF